MRPRLMLRSTRTRLRALLAGTLTATLAGTMVGTLPVAPAHAANPVTPGNFTGLGFDQCEAPSQHAMSTWIKKSPFRAAGIYISGASRACQRQTNLTPTWVRNQLAAGWRLMPITLGPQASCSHRYPRYGKKIDPTIDPSTTNTYAAARGQGSREADRAVAAATRLGIVKGSTIFYDLEAFDTGKSTACTSSALWFVHAWTRRLHTLGYASGFYSSAASGIKLLDDARVRSGNPYTLPDQIWIADWDGKANTSSTYVRSDGWQPYSRAKQYKGGHNETWGGVRINIDRNYLKLRTPKIPGSSSTAPAPTPAPAPPSTAPRYTGTSLADARCTSRSISKPSYRNTSASLRTHLITPLQCLLKQQRLYRYEVTGRWNPQTTTALRAFQKRVSHKQRSYATRGDFVALLAAGNSGRTLRAGSSGADVVMLQRALNAAGTWQLSMTGRFDARTASATAAYRRMVGLRAVKQVDSRTWSALRAGRYRR